MPKRKAMKVRKKSSSRLPKRLLFIPSVDKYWIESWRPGQDPLNFPASWRMVLCGMLFLKNVIIRARPKFERIFVMHQDPYAREYDDIEAEIITKLPPNEFWMGCDLDEENGEIEEPEEIDRPKTLVVIDDICFKDLPKDQTMLRWTVSAG
jgi:hypothetical protein